MPKRIIDGEGMYGSDKLRRCPLWIRKEYPWLYPLADCNGSFELNQRVIAGKLWPNRPDLTEKKAGTDFPDFQSGRLGLPLGCREPPIPALDGLGARRKAATALQADEKVRKELGTTASTEGICSLFATI